MLKILQGPFLTRVQNVFYVYRKLIK